MIACAQEEKHVDGWLLQEKGVCQASIEGIEDLEHIVANAAAGGILSGNEAELLQHSMHDYVHKFERRISQLLDGRAKEAIYCDQIMDKYESLDGGPHGHLGKLVEEDEEHEDQSG